MEKLEGLEFGRVIDGTDLTVDAFNERLIEFAMQRGYERTPHVDAHGESTDLLHEADLALEWLQAQLQGIAAHFEIHENSLVYWNEEDVEEATDDPEELSPEEELRIERLL